MNRGMKLSRKFQGASELNQNDPSVCRLSKEPISNISGTVLCVKLKLAELIVGDIELAKRRFLYTNATTSIHSTSTAAKAKASTINSTTTTTATSFTITTCATSAVAKAKGTIKLRDMLRACC